MVENKKPRNYRFSPDTLRRLKWLSAKTDRSETEILETAVKQVYDDEWAKMRSHLIPAEQGWYDYVVGGVPLVKIQEKALVKLGEHTDQMLSEAGGPDNLLGLVILAAGSVPSKMVFYQDNIDWFYEPLREEIDRIRKTLVERPAKK